MGRSAVGTMIRALAATGFAAVAGIAVVAGWTRPAVAVEVLVHVGNLSVPAGTIVHGDAIALGGSLDVEGTVEGDALASGGNVTVGGHVSGSVRALGGDVRLLRTAIVGGTAAAWGGTVTKEPGASVGAGPQAPSPGAPPAPSPGPPFPAPPGPPFAVPPPWWWVPGIFGVIAAFHVLYWLIVLAALAGFISSAWLTAILFPRVLTSLAEELERQPAAAFAAGLIGWVLLWPLVVLLALTVVGLAIVILIPAAVLIMLQFGTTAVALLAGRRIRPSSTGVEAFVGSIVLSIGFAIPHLGWILVLAVATWGWGVTLLALFARARRFPPPAPA